MKLYTEEQVKQMILLAKFSSRISYIDIIEKFTPIEILTDLEIEKQSRGKSVILPTFISGAKWMRDKIQGGNK